MNGEQGPLADIFMKDDFQKYGNQLDTQRYDLNKDEMTGRYVNDDIMKQRNIEKESGDVVECFEATYMEEMQTEKKTKADEKTHKKEEVDNNNGYSTSKLHAQRA
eukprot:10182393-Heterocapsa_arctica.AAC.1